MNAHTPTVTSGELPASRKVHKTGKLHPAIRVPMREISLHPTSGEPPVTVYDSSGPYTDAAVKTDIERGLPRLREDWIVARGDVERYEGRAVKAPIIQRCRYARTRTPAIIHSANARVVKPAPSVSGTGTTCQPSSDPSSSGLVA